MSAKKVSSGLFSHTLVTMDSIGSVVLRDIDKMSVSKWSGSAGCCTVSHILFHTSKQTKTKQQPKTKRSVGPYVTAPAEGVGDGGTGLTMLLKTTNSSRNVHHTS